MKKIILISLIFLVSTFGNNVFAKKIKLVYIPPNQSEAWHVATRTAGSMFAEDLGVELIVLDPQNDPAEQVKMARNIAPHVDGAVIIMVTSAARKMAEEFKKVNPNMPVICVDRDAPSEFIDMFVAFGNKDAGSIQAQRIAGLLKSKYGTAKGTVQLVTGDLGSTVAQERRDGVLEGLKKYPGIKVVNVVEATKWSASSAQEKMMASLIAHGRPDAILTSFDGGAVGAVNALKSKGWLKKTGDPNHVFIGVIDAATIVFKYMREGYVDFTLSQPNLSYVPVGMFLAKLAIEEGLGALPKPGQKIYESDIPLGRIGRAHKGINPWQDAFWAPAKVIDRPDMKHPQFLMKGAVVTLENVNYPFYWGNVMPIWGD